MPTMMLNDLPSELLIKILANVPARDIGSVSKVNPNFNQVSREEFLWILLALRDFRVKLTVTQEFSPRNFYQRVLYPYRGCLGLWHRQNLPHYSGLLRVGVSSDCLLFEELVPSPTVRGPLQCVEFLRITCSSNDGAAVIVNHNTLAMSDVVEVGIPEKNCGRLTILLPNIQDNTTEPSEWMKEKFLRLVFGEDKRNNYLATMRFMSTFRSRAEYFYSRLSANWKTNNSSTPIREGLYVGSYGVHGVEMISVTSPSNCAKGTTGRKVTGDPNVPFNEITFRVTSEECLDIPLEVQADVRRLIEFEDDPTYKLYEEDGSIPFTVPEDCTEREEILFNFCKGRWSCECQVAGHGFLNPSFIKGNLIAFSDDLLAVIFLDLYSISLYRRVTDEL